MTQLPSPQQRLSIQVSSSGEVRVEVEGPLDQYQMADLTRAALTTQGQYQQKARQNGLNDLLITLGALVSVPVLAFLLFSLIGEMFRRPQPVNSRSEIHQDAAFL